MTIFVDNNYTDAVITRLFKQTVKPLEHQTTRLENKLRKLDDANTISRNQYKELLRLANRDTKYDRTGLSSREIEFMTALRFGDIDYGAEVKKGIIVN